MVDGGNSMKNALTILIFLQLISSAIAAIFWMSAAFGKMVVWPWQAQKDVPAADLAAHQAKWNANAAAATGVAVIFQMIVFLLQNPQVLVLH
jgi:low affinity Fe/Cu permease